MRRLALLLAFVLCGGAFAATEKEVLDIAKKASEGNRSAADALAALSRDGDAFAAHMLGRLHLVGRGVAHSEAKAIEQFGISAIRGRLDSAHNLAVLYQNAAEKLRDPVAARTWFRHAAERGYASSQAKLGEMLLDGGGGPVNVEEARGWIEKAAGKGDARGLYLLGVLRLEGRAGLEKNPEEAARLLQRAAEGKDRDAQYQLALLYGTGRGVPKDDAQALKWLGEAAAQKLPEAEYRLATVYDRGLFGEPRNEATAVKWLRFAARQGHPDAMYALGLMHAEGRGVKQDASEAYGWFLESARKGHPRGIEQVLRIQSRATPLKLAPREEDKK